MSSAALSLMIDVPGERVNNVTPLPCCQAQDSAFVLTCLALCRRRAFGGGAVGSTGRHADYSGLSHVSGVALLSVRKRE